MGEIRPINSVCLSHCIYLSVRTITVAFLDRFSSKSGTEWQRRQQLSKAGKVHLVNIAPPLPLFCPQNCHFGSKSPKNPCKHK